MNQINARPAKQQQRADLIVPFLLGTLVGGLAGTVVGTLLCHRSTDLAMAVLDTVSRRLSDEEQQRLRFDLLLQ